MQRALRRTPRGIEFRASAALRCPSASMPCPPTSALGHSAADPDLFVTRTAVAPSKRGSAQRHRRARTARGTSRTRRVASATPPRVSTPSGPSGHRLPLQPPATCGFAATASRPLGISCATQPRTSTSPRSRAARVHEVPQVPPPRIDGASRPRQISRTPRANASASAVLLDDLARKLPCNGRAHPPLASSQPGKLRVHRPRFARFRRGGPASS
mmetsp:Transcript_3196/g.9055  ORF Transcript_3196/g.9055 Transcript_3196/m.9055 type:complete len:214 (+) Transcript_3196:837-1478(+)